MPKLLESIVRAFISVAKWYMRRRRITKVFIFLLLLLPLILYSYWRANLYIAKYTSQPFIVVEELPNLNLSKTPCNTFFSGKTLFILGTLSVPSTCFLLNDTTALYPSKGGFAEVILYGNKTYPVAVVLVLPRNLTLTVENTTLHVEWRILVVYQNSTKIDYASIKTGLEEYGLRDVFCKVAIPSSNGWGKRTVPEQLYDYVCLLNRPS